MKNQCPMCGKTVQEHVGPCPNAVYWYEAAHTQFVHESKELLLGRARGRRHVEAVEEFRAHATVTFLMAQAAVTVLTTSTKAKLETERAEFVRMAEEAWDDAFAELKKYVREQVGKVTAG